MPCTRAEFAQSVHGTDTAAPLLDSLQRIPAEHDPLQRMLFPGDATFSRGSQSELHRSRGMAAGVEVRVPLLDLDLVRFAAQVPSRIKQRGPVGKAIFKRAMEPYLPHEVIYRPKIGFGAPLRRWLRQDCARRWMTHWIGRACAAAAISIPRGTATDRSGRRPGQIDGSYTIFALMCFELWCRRFVDR